MKIIGKVVAILNDQYLLIQTDGQDLLDDEVTVFLEVADEKLHQATNLNRLIFPKGKLRIICEQEDNILLAERFRDIIERRKTITIPSLASRGITAGLMGIGGLADYLPETKEIVEEVPGRWSAVLNKEDELGIFFEKTVRVGDLVGIL